jgi:hypothetical protein
MTSFFGIKKKKSHIDFHWMTIIALTVKGAGCLHYYFLWRWIPEVWIFLPTPLYYWWMIVVGKLDYFVLGQAGHSIHSDQYNNKEARGLT